MSKPTLFAFAASSRGGSYNQQLLSAALADVGDGATLDREMDYTQLTLPAFEDAYFDEDRVPAQATAIAQRVADADALMIAAPEYNWSMPGSLKNTIDWISRTNIKAFNGKPILLLCASPSTRGGTVGLTQLRVPFEVLGAWVYPQLLTVGAAHTAFAEDGTLLDTKNRKFVKNSVTDFIAKANLLT